jgi:hypothetical protein
MLGGMSKNVDVGFNSCRLHAFGESTWPRQYSRISSTLPTEQPQSFENTAFPGLNNDQPVVSFRVHVEEGRKRLLNKYYWRKATQLQRSRGDGNRSNTFDSTPRKKPILMSHPKAS